MVEPVKNEIIQRFETNFGIGGNMIRLIGYHVTALKLIEIIFNTIKPTVDSELDTEWFQTYLQTPYGKKPTVKTLEQWINEKFLPPLSAEINSLIERDQEHFIMRGLTLTLSREQRQQQIYRGIFTYIDRNIDDIYGVTPWDIVKVLTNENRQSLIRLVQFPSTISVKFVVNNTPILNVYDLDLDQFMGMILALRLVTLQATITIFEITTNIQSFDERLSQYNEKQYNKIPSLYALEVTGEGIFDYNTNVFKFDNMNFISGFITPFTWVGLDHHNYWTKFIQFANRNDETGTDLTF
ncbi:Hypothetical protein HVR_LOCUS89 [uncultured virus]|nr:Hypothetical protein HVR_LOCUS89 [uncultured virus]